MEIREEPKRLLERIEAIEAENRASKETAEKNFATISEEIENPVVASIPLVGCARKV